MAMLDVTAHPPGQGRGPLTLAFALLHFSGKKNICSIATACHLLVKKNGSNTQLKNAYPSVTLSLKICQRMNG
jgi:hypothetical protein